MAVAVDASAGVDDVAAQTDHRAIFPLKRQVTKLTAVLKELHAEK